MPHDPNCSYCEGAGQYLGHAPTCDDDLCALNGDMHSCAGQVMTCDCEAPDSTGVQLMSKTPEQMTRLDVSVLLDPAYGDPEQYREGAERLLLLYVALRAAGTRQAEIDRRMRGYERDIYEAA
jgi:hypothetical protein